MTREIFEFSHVPAGVEYEALVRWAMCLAEFGEVHAAKRARYDDATVLLKLFGSRPRKGRRSAPATAELTDAILQVSNRLDAWNGDELPDDFALYDSDGRVLLASACSGEWRWLEATAHELAQMDNVVRESLGLHRIEVPLQHPLATWRDRADTIVRVFITHLNADEELPARALGDGLFEICAIGFHTYEIALGDIVHAEPDGDEWRLVNRVQPSGNETRWLKCDRGSEGLALVLERLQAEEVLVEAANPWCIAINLAPQPEGRCVDDYLDTLSDDPDMHFHW